MVADESLCIESFHTVKILVWTFVATTDVDIVCKTTATVHITLLAKLWHSRPGVCNNIIHVTAGESATISRADSPTDYNVLVIEVSEGEIAPGSRRLSFTRRCYFIVQETIVKDPGWVMSIALETVQASFYLNREDVGEVKIFVGEPRRLLC